MNVFSLVLSLMKAVISFNPCISILTLSLMIIRSLTSGVGLLMVIPLLQVIGIRLMEQQHHLFIDKIGCILMWAHIPLTLPTILGVLIAIMTSVATIHFFEENMRTYWQEKYRLHLRNTIYSALLNTSWTFILRKNLSELLNGITTQFQASWLCHYFLLQLLNQLILISVYVFLSSLISWQMTCIAGVISMGLLALMRPLHRFTAQRGQTYVQQQQNLFQSIYEQLNALKMIKSCNKEQVFLNDISAKSLAIKLKNQSFTRVSTACKWLYSVGSVLAFSTLLYLALNIFTLPVQSIILMLIVFSRLLPSVSALQQTYQQLLQQLPAYTNLQQLYHDSLAHQEQSLDDLRTGTSQSIEFYQSIRFEKLSFSYPGTPTLPIFNQFSLTIYKKTTTVLSGASGSGKTTLVDLIVGLLRPDKGEILIDKQPLTQNHLCSWRQKIAYLPQEAYLFQGSIRDNLLLFSPNASEKELDKALHQASAYDFVMQLPQKLETWVGERGICLSGGERQRIALARALLMKPELLILDESTNALDEYNARMIKHSLHQLHGKITLIIISHQADFYDFADQLITLDNIKKQHHNPVRVTSDEVIF